jgi:hypothetical protein
VVRQEPTGRIQLAFEKPLCAAYTDGTIAVDMGPPSLLVATLLPVDCGTDAFTQGCSAQPFFPTSRVNQPDH